MCSSGRARRLRACAVTVPGARGFLRWVDAVSVHNLSARERMDQRRSFLSEGAALTWLIARC